MTPAAATMPDVRRRGQERRLIFSNVANGVPVEKVMAAFRRSEAEVDRELEFVGRKIREARFRTRMPPIEAQGIRAIRFNRRALLDTLRQLTDEYLASDLVLPKIGVQEVDSASILQEAAHAVRARFNGP